MGISDRLIFYFSNATVIAFEWKNSLFVDRCSIFDTQCLLLYRFENIHVDRFLIYWNVCWLNMAD